MLAGNRTSIFRCKKCGIETRHRWETWKNASPLSWLGGQAGMVEGWICTKCGKRVRVTMGK
jgi:hypothetical protein